MLGWVKLALVGQNGHQPGETMPKLTREEVIKRLSYNPETGVFSWRDKKYSKKGFNITGGKSRRGYERIGIKGVKYYSHRLAWLYVYGYWPENDIDHIDRDKGNNRINNLREVSRSCNNKNSGNMKNNKSGIKGVCFSRSHKKWQTEITVNGNAKHLGFFEKKIDAAHARFAAEKKYGWHECDNMTTAKQYLKDRGFLKNNGQV